MSMHAGMMCLGLVASLSLVTFAYAELDCAQLDEAATLKGVNIPLCQATYAVVGKGHLPFYSAPNVACPLKGVFIIPGDRVVVYTEYQGFSSVMYVNPKTHDDVVGWVRSDRLAATGTGIAPCQ